MPDPRTLRYTGLAAAGLLAVAGRLGGALPHGDIASTPVSVATGPYGPVILLCWLAGTLVQARVWWSLRDRVPSARWAVVTAALWTAPLLVAPPLGSRDVYSYACQGELFRNGLDPYRHGASALPCTWIEAVSPIWRDTTAPYGPLFILLAGGVVVAGAGSLLLTVALFRLVTVAALAGIAACLPVIARRCGVPVERALWVALAGPLIGAHLLAGPHNDALMIFFLVAALAVPLVHRSRLGGALLAGVLLGLAIAVKATAVVVLPFAVLLVARPLARPAVAVTGAAALTLTAVSAVTGLGWGWIGGMTHVRDLVQFTSPPTAVGMTATYVGQLVNPGFDAVPLVRVLALLALAAALTVLWWRALRAPDPVAAGLRGAAGAFALTVALAPSFHPWYALAPLMLLAATTTRTRIAMLVSAAAPLLVLPDGSGLARYVKFPGAPLMSLLLLVLLLRRGSGSAPAAGAAHPRSGPVPAPRRPRSDIADGNARPVAAGPEERPGM